MGIPLDRFGKYVVLESLGQGGTACVDLALALEPGGGERFVVLKRPRKERDENGSLVRLLIKEALLTARLTHPNLVTVHGVEQDGDEIAIVMEHLDGHSLAELTEEHRANGTHAPVPVALAMLRDALLGIDAAHEATDPAGRPLRLVHRDLTPQNLFVTRDGHTKVLDFGIAKLAEGTWTATGLIKGTLGYMAPEQILAEKLDRRVDVYSAGVVLWELLAGRRIARSKSILEVVRCASDPIPALCDEVSWIDPELSAIVARAVTVEREDRYSTAAELRAALDDYAVTHGLFAAPFDVARHVDSVLGADTRARDARIRQLYPFARRLLAHDKRVGASAPALRIAPPQSDAPTTTDSFRDERPLTSVVRRLLVTGTVAAAAAVAVASAWSYFARSALSAAPARAREHVFKQLVTGRPDTAVAGADPLKTSPH